MGCKKFPPPSGELCAYHTSGVLVCNDPRKKPSDYERRPMNGDLVSAPESFERIKAYCAEMRSRLIKCERKQR